MGMLEIESRTVALGADGINRNGPGWMCVYKRGLGRKRGEARQGKGSEGRRKGGEGLRGDMGRVTMCEESGGEH